MSADAPGWRLTPRARQSLVDIALYTLDRFGPAQAALYETELVARCDAIAAGRAHVRDCSALAGVAPGRLFFARAGEHFALFTRSGGAVVITDFLHARSDLPARLAALGLLGD